MRFNPESFVRSAVKSLSSYRYHQSHARDAKRILEHIAGAKGPLSQRTVKCCDDYAMAVLGHRRFAAWLYVYSAVAGQFKEGWIPDNYYGAVVTPRLKGEYAKVSNLKPLNSVIFASTSFPDILSYSNGVFFDTEYRVLPPASIKDALFADHDQVVFKLTNSSRGRGIFFFDAKSFDPNKICTLGNGLFQRWIDQHEVFREFAEKSVATLRMTTVMQDDGTASLRACYLRLGAGADTHVQSSSSVKVPIDPKSGVFSDVGFTTDWLELDRHPDSKVRFQGKCIPAYSECCTLVTTLHKRVPYTRCVGWDVTVDTMQHVRVMEWNGGHNDIKFSEATQGPCFSDLHWERLIR